MKMTSLTNKTLLKISDNLALLSLITVFITIEQPKLIRNIRV